MSGHQWGGLVLVCVGLPGAVLNLVFASRRGASLTVGIIGAIGGFYATGWGLLALTGRVR